MVEPQCGDQYGASMWLDRGDRWRMRSSNWARRWRSMEHGSLNLARQGRPKNCNRFASGTQQPKSIHVHRFPLTLRAASRSNLFFFRGRRQRAQPFLSKNVIHCAKSHFSPLRGERGARGRLFGVNGERGGGSRSEKLSEKGSSSCFLKGF